MKSEMAFSQSMLPVWHLSVTNGAWSWSYVVAAIIIFPFAIQFLHRHLAADRKSFEGQWPDCIDSAFLQHMYMTLLQKIRPSQAQLVPDLPDSLGLGRGFLEALPARTCSRPQATRLTGKLQSIENAAKAMSAALSAKLIGFATTYSDHTYLGRSTFERNETALFSRCPTYSATRYFGEICHINSTESTVHLTLHPKDAQTVMDAGWGERDPLAQGMVRRLSDKLTSTPTAWHMMVKFPRDKGELQTVTDIMKAAVWWISGVNATLTNEGWA